MKYLFIFFVSLNVFYSALAYAADCTTVKGTTVTISATCTNGLSTVSLDNNFNQTRPIVTLGFDNNLSSSEKISATFQYQELSYESKEETNFYIYYTLGL